MTDLRFVAAVAGAAADAVDAPAGGLLVDGVEAGWYEGFHDPLADVHVLRLWLDAAHLASAPLAVISDSLVAEMGALARGLAAGPANGARAGTPEWCTVESNRVFALRGAEPASVLLRISRRRQACGRCRWELTAADDWLVDELAASFVAGCRRLAASVEPDRARRFVTGDLVAEPNVSCWSLDHDGRRSGVVMSAGHEDLADGRPYAQCVDAVGAHSEHFSCLAASVGADLRCEVRGEVTVGMNRDRERAVVRRLHGEGWQVRGMTSLFSPRWPEPAGGR